ncbi:MAG: GDSL-type esterase/lipase family protein [Kiritimatiellales bacterium]
MAIGQKINKTYVFFVLIYVFRLQVNAAISILYTAPGNPAEQQWAADLRGITVKGITNVINEVIYPAWEFDSLKDQQGWYLNNRFSQTARQAMLESGWTWTYISRTTLAPSAGYHSAKFRDGVNLWSLQFRQSSSPGSNNGVWLHFGSGKYIHLKALSLNDDFCVVQVTCTPANPGFHDDNDLIAFYVNGEKVHEMRRRQQDLTTGVVRGEILDEASGGPGNFAVNLYRIDTGINLDAYHSAGGVFFSLIFVENTATIPAPPRNESYLHNYHSNFVQQALAGGIDVLFIGDSITEYWCSPGCGLPVWNRLWSDDFPGINAANFGVNSDLTQHVLWRLKNGEGFGFSPKVVVLLIGTNNTTPNNTTPEIIAGVTAVVKQLKTGFPQTKILLLGVLPRGQKKDAKRLQIIDVNRGISKLHDGERVFYLDIGDQFLDADGEIPVEWMPDGLHPNLSGYQIFAAAIKDLLAQLFCMNP